MRLQRIPFDRSGIPPGRSSLAFGQSLSRCPTEERTAWLHLEFGIFRPTQSEEGARFEAMGWDEPPPAVAHMYEQPVASRRVEVFDDPAPTLIAAGS